jgi:type VI secretion system protein ImpK
LITAALSTPVSAQQAAGTKDLQELLEDGIYLLFLLRNGNAPNSTVEFNKRVDQFLTRFESDARNFGKSAAAISDAKYAFCALMDEIVLSSGFSIREDWERSPLQLRLFGEHLAGERFFDKLDMLRMDPAANLEVLEVFYVCLLLGFQGKYLLEGTEKLNYLVSRVGQEITHARGGRAEFAPNWKLPQRFQHYVRNELSLWLFFAILAVVASIIFFGFHWYLLGGTHSLRQYQSQPVPTLPVDGEGTKTPRTAS